MTEIQKLSFFDYVKGRKIKYMDTIFKPLELIDGDRMKGTTYYPSGRVHTDVLVWGICDGMEDWSIVT